MGDHVVTTGRGNGRAIAAALVAVVAALTVIVGFSGAASAQTCPSGTSATTAAGGGAGGPTTTRPSPYSANARIEGQRVSGPVVGQLAAAPSQTCPAKTGANMVVPLAGGAAAIAVVVAVRRVLSARNLA